MLEQTYEIFKNKQLHQNQDRIISQLKFGYLLSKENDGKYDKLLQTAEKHIQHSFTKNNLTSSDLVTEVESILQPLSQLAKSYEILCVAHAHIDMNWQWGYDETVMTVIDTMQTMLQILKEYPEYKFSQSQAAVYKILADYRQDLIDEIKHYIKQGRWEVSASTWVEADKNMPTGESLARQLLYAKSYLSKLLDIDPNKLDLDFEPDTFGHSEFIPEILVNSGVKYYYHCRGEESLYYLYRWIAPSGAEILTYREPNFYNATIDSDVGLTVPEIARVTKSKSVLKVYGVGDHGGGPTRRDIERIMDMNTWPIYPKLRFSTYKEYFTIVAKNIEKLPKLKGERNFLCDGCFTSQSKIKEGNRKCEKMLNAVESFSNISYQLTNNKYDTKSLNDAWQKVLFNQFHDIITGSCSAESKHHALSLYQEAMAIIKSNQKVVLKNIGDKIDTSKFSVEKSTNADISYGAGSGHIQSGYHSGKTRIYNIFNPLTYELKKLCNIMVWDYEGDFNRILVKDENNKPLNFQVGETSHYWGHSFTQVYVEISVPAQGYSTCIICEGPISDIPLSYHIEMRKQHEEVFILENDLLFVKLKPSDGSIESMIDKKSGRELVDRTNKYGIFRLAYESAIKQITNWKDGMSSWFTGRYKSIKTLNNYIEIKPTVSGKLMNSIQYITKFNNSSLNVTVTLEKGSSNLKFDVECDWKEIGDCNTGVPVLNFYLPLPYTCQSYRFDVPFGKVERCPMDIDRPANSTVMGIPEEKNTSSLALVTTSKYGFRCVDNAISLTLIRSSYDPDKYPEISTHSFSFWVSVLDGECQSSSFIKNSINLNTDFAVITNEPHTGLLPLSTSIFSIEGEGFIVSSVKMSESRSNRFILRLYETEGKEQSGRIIFYKKPLDANLVDIHEQAVKANASIKIKDNSIVFKIPPHKIWTLAIDTMNYDCK